MALQTSTLVSATVSFLNGAVTVAEAAGQQQNETGLESKEHWLVECAKSYHTLATIAIIVFFIVSLPGNTFGETHFTSVHFTSVDMHLASIAYFTVTSFAPDTAILIMTQQKHSTFSTILSRQQTLHAKHTFPHTHTHTHTLGAA